MFLQRVGRVLLQNSPKFLVRPLSTTRTLESPKIPAPAPDFKGIAVFNNEFKEVSLKDFRGKYLVLFFYPLDFTFVCPTELIAFSDHIKEFEAINCALVGCSCDSHFSHLAFIQRSRKEGGLGGLNYPLLADYKKEISRSYDVLLEDEGVPLRGLFIIDKEGNLRQKTVNDLPVGRSVDEVLRLVKAFQFVEEHGEVCPANWQPGSKTIKADPKGSQAYFQTANK